MSSTDSLIELAERIEVPEGIDLGTALVANSEIHTLRDAVAGYDVGKKYNNWIDEYAAEKQREESTDVRSLQLSKMTTEDKLVAEELYHERSLVNLVGKEVSRLAKPRKLMAIVLSGIALGGVLDGGYYALGIEHNSRDVPAAERASNQEEYVYYPLGIGVLGLVLGGAMGWGYGLGDGPLKYARKRAQKQINNL